MKNSPHVSARAIKLWSHDHIYNMIWVTWQNFVYDVMDRTFNVLILSIRQPGVFNFADTIEITIMLIKTTFNESTRIRKNQLTCNFCLYFLIYILFGSSLNNVYLCQVSLLGDVLCNLLTPPTVNSLKTPILNRVN